MLSELGQPVLSPPPGQGAEHRARRPGEALLGAVEWLVARQDPGGWWVGELETNVTMTAEHVLLLRFLGVDPTPVRDGAIRHLLREQREDGSWALYYDGPADLSTTIEAYAALKVLGVDATSGPMVRALRVIHQQGGVARARVFTKIWLALFGAYPWQGIPSMPPELIALPSRAPLSLYRFAAWARGTIAPLLVVLSRRPTRPLGVSLDELVVAGTEPLLERVPGSGPFWWLDRLQKLYERFPVQPGRDAARRRVVGWVVERQEADGGWGGIQPPWVYSLIALSVEGRGLDDPVIRRGLEGMQGFVLDDRDGWRFQACMSPVWDTAWAMRALRRAGIGPGDPVQEQAAAWLLREQIRPEAPGDWRVLCPGRPCGGWAFEFDNDSYPDVDDTAVVAVALLEAGSPSPAIEHAVERAVQWTAAMRSRNGAWASFDRDNTDALAYRLPFADFGAMIDPPTEDVTAHVLEMLGAVGRGVHDPLVSPALRYLAQTQGADGAWFGRWGVNYLYGTWCAVTGLAALRTRAPEIAGAARWVIGRQNADGGWGESCRSYDDPSFAGIGSSTASQTAWAVMTLQSAGLGTHPACLRGARYLAEQQRDGTWEEPEHTGTGFPGDFYINYHLYRHLFPTMALAQQLALETGSTGDGTRPSLPTMPMALPPRAAPGAGGSKSSSRG